MALTSAAFASDKEANGSSPASLEHNQLQPKALQSKPQMPMIRMGTATEEEREKAKSSLSILLSECKGSNITAPVKALQVALLDGDTAGMKKAFFDAGLNVEQQFQAVCELQRELDEAGADMYVALTHANAFIWYMGKSHYGVEVSATSRPVVRPLQLPYGGIVVLQDGEVLNSDPNEMARFYANHAVLQITADRSRFPNLNTLDRSQSERSDSE
jgi:hypothetical protein